MAEQEIKVTIPSLSREQIFHPRPVVKLEKWKPVMKCKNMAL